MMASKNDDEELLEAYAQGGCDNAFRQLVERHVDLVYGVAIRRTGKHEMAEEIAQRVFIILCRKARIRLKKRSTLANWLYQTTLYQSSQAWRSERRWQGHRKSLVEQEKLRASHQPENLSSIREELDEAIGRLCERDRSAILCRFFEDKSYREIGHLLDKSEDAARKLTQRALARLRVHLENQGTTVTVASLGAIMTGEAAVTAPSTVIPKVMNSIVGKTSLAPTLLETLGSMKIATVVLVVVGAMLPISISRTVRNFQEIPAEANSIEAERAAPTVAMELADGSRANRQLLADRPPVDLQWLAREFGRYPLSGEEMEREVRLERLMHELTLEEVPEVWRLIESSENRDYLQAVTRALFGRWAELDPRQAVGELEKLGNDRIALIVAGYDGAMSTWLKLAPAAAVAYVSQDPQKRLMRGQISDAMARLAPREMLSLAVNLESEDYRKRMIAEAVSGWALRDLEASIDWVRQEFDGAQQPHWIGSIVGTLITNRRYDEALETVLELEPSPIAEMRLKSLVEAHAERNPEEAIALYEKLPAGFQSFEVSKQLASSIVHQHRSRAEELLRNQSTLPTSLIDEVLE